MKKIVLIIAMVALTTAVFAENLEDVGTIRLSGTVDKNVSIAVSGLNDYDNLDLTIDVSDLAVVAVTETSNVREGYTVSLNSANATTGTTENAFFLGLEGGEQLSYNITYDNVPVTFTAGSAEVTNANAKTGLNGQDRVLTISYSAAEAHLGNDLYSDDLTFTITAK